MSGIRAVFETTDPVELEIDLEVGPSETVVVLGPNGAGKSSLVSTLAGLTPVSSGRVELAGVVVDEPASGLFVPPEERDVGVVFQDYLLFPNLSVLDNVAFGLRARGVAAGEAERKANDWLKLLEVEEFAARLPKQISGGQAQRVALARAMITNPSVLLLDEPLSALDVTARAETRRLLKSRLDEFAGPRLLITHDASEAFTFADRIYVLEGGRVTQKGAAEEIRLRPRTTYVAEFAGKNLIHGVAANGVVSTGEVRLAVADRAASGPVIATIDPRAISLHNAPPEGSPRNSWLTTTTEIEDTGGRCRVLVGDPLPMIVEITAESVSALGLSSGSQVWIALKATEISVEPA